MGMTKQKNICSYSCGIAYRIKVADFYASCVAVQHKYFKSAKLKHALAWDRWILKEAVAISSYKAMAHTLCSAAFFHVAYTISKVKKVGGSEAFGKLKLTLKHLFKLFVSAVGIRDNEEVYHTFSATRSSFCAT